MTKDAALALRKAMDNGLESLSNKEILLLKFMFPAWECGQSYEEGEYIRNKSKLYKILNSCTPVDLSVASLDYEEIKENL